jgi:hypothetical protein
MVLAIGLGVAGLFLVVTGDSAKQLRIGVLLGLWGGLTALFVLFGSRRRGGVVSDSDLSARELAARRDYELNAAKGRELELRRNFEIELERHVAGRREYELQLEVMLRREMERALRDELSELKTEVAGLRGDLAEKINGQLLLERIETTRVFGSDLEALQAEVRRLSGSHDVLASPAFTAPPSLTEPMTVLEPLSLDSGSSPANGTFSANGSTVGNGSAPNGSAPNGSAPNGTTPNGAGAANGMTSANGAGSANGSGPGSAVPGPAASPPGPIDYPQTADYRTDYRGAASEPDNRANNGAGHSGADEAGPLISPAALRAAVPGPPASPSPASPAPTTPAPVATSPAPAVATAAPAKPVAEPVPSSSADSDPFAGMPRLGTFVDVPLEGETEPAPTSPAVPTGVAAPNGSAEGRATTQAGPQSSQPGDYQVAPASGSGPSEPQANSTTGPYVGRRRSEQDLTSSDGGGSGRRRRPDSEGDDVLGRLLGR